MMIALRRRRDASSTIDLPSPAAVRPSEERISGRRKRAVSLVLKDNTPKDLTMTEWPTGAASLFRDSLVSCLAKDQCIDPLELREKSGNTPLI
ncbi:hypothetical protein YC2023_053407 [Brassica napus]|uniref:(rape) hypothetical protein n=1 Tax=Brassica napus TaxID=3708 RepID=A0A816K1B0_BRANA|nr:unnamed protein product [Brassica napus]